MLTEPLPGTLDVRKAAVRGVNIRGAIKPHQLQRFRTLLASDEGSVSVDLAFSRDAENRYLVRIRVSAEVDLVCQRCLETMTIGLSSDNTLAVVATDEQAARLPGYLDPLVVVEEQCNLWELVEDELILALPSFSYHNTVECRKKLADYVGTEAHEQVDNARPNPFQVLAQLKRGEEN